MPPGLTLNRATTGTRTTPSGAMELRAVGSPRFNYDPLSLQCKGLLIEEARTNLCTTSATTAANTGTTAAVNATNMFGTANAATTLTEDTSTGLHFAFSGVNVDWVTATTYCATAYISAGTATRVQLTVTTTNTVGSATTYSNFNLVGAGSVLANGAGTVGSIRLVATGVYACTINFVSGGTLVTGTPIIIGFINSDTATRLPSYTGTSLTLVVHGAQVEAAGVPSSYFPTTGAAAARGQDNGVGFPVGPWYNQSEGTFVVEIIAVNSLDQQAFGVWDSAQSNSIRMRKNAGNTPSATHRVAAATLDVNGGAVTQNETTLRLGYTYGPRGRFTSWNGANPASAAALPNNGYMGQVFFGGLSALGAAFQGGHIRTMDYYPSQVSPAELARMSSLSWPARKIRPDFSLHFLDGVLPPGVTFTRASSATRVNSSGVMVTETTNVPRFDYDPITLALLGLRSEETRTNSLLRTDMAGAVVGTPGTLPTGWGSVLSGATHSVAGTGTENGMPYVDLRFQTAGAVSASRVVFNNGFNTAATPAQLWASSFYARVVSGSLSGVSLRSRITWRDAGFALLSTSIGSTNLVGTSPTLLGERSEVAGTAPASTAFMGSELTFDTTGATDVTIRIGHTQAEVGAFVTSPILTTGAAATRAADFLSHADVSWWNRGQGTVVTEHISSHAAAAEFGIIWEMRQGASGLTTSVFVVITNSSGNRVRSQTKPGGVALIDTGSGGAAIANAVVKSALSYSPAVQSVATSGGPAITASVALTDMVPGLLNLASTNNPTYGPQNTLSLNGWFRHFDYYKVAMPNDFLSELAR